MSWTATAMLAHQGGWDEAILIGAPMLAIVALLALAKRRVDAATARARAIEEPDQVNNG